MHYPSPHFCLYPPPRPHLRFSLRSLPFLLLPSPPYPPVLPSPLSSPHQFSALCTSHASFFSFRQVLPSHHLSISTPPFPSALPSASSLSRLPPYPPNPSRGFTPSIIIFPPSFLFSSSHFLTFFSRLFSMYAPPSPLLTSFSVGYPSLLLSFKPPLSPAPDARPHLSSWLSPHSRA